MCAWIVHIYCRTDMQTIPTSDITGNAPTPALHFLCSITVKIILLEYGFGAEMLKIYNALHCQELRSNLANMCVAIGTHDSPKHK